MADDNFIYTPLLTADLARERYKLNSTPRPIPHFRAPHKPHNHLSYLLIMFFASPFVSAALMMLGSVTALPHPLALLDRIATTVPRALAAPPDTLATVARTLPSRATPGSISPTWDLLPAYKPSQAFSRASAPVLHPPLAPPDRTSLMFSKHSAMEPPRVASNNSKFTCFQVLSKLTPSSQIREIFPLRNLLRMGCNARQRQRQPSELHRLEAQRMAQLWRRVYLQPNLQPNIDSFSLAGETIRGLIGSVLLLKYHFGLRFGSLTTLIRPIFLANTRLQNMRLRIFFSLAKCGVHDRRGHAGSMLHAPRGLSTLLILLLATAALHASALAVALGNEISLCTPRFHVITGRQAKWMETPIWTLGLQKHIRWTVQNPC
ncbi:hypothetical protein R3P38DRAFT_3167146 [Favolaschia claudopus]|uniref:Uncharacterized protein n=1 Tax=Favolaschia claudopus TaxID=2862362 RepID=A0AAW0EEU3_9AGAR